MRTKFSGLLTLLLVFLVQITFAQEKTITGNVTDSEGLPLPGATIQIKGTSTGTQTDFDGNFTITASPEDVLLVTFVGFETIEQPVGSSNSFNWQMQESSVALDDVVVEAYRTTTKKKSNIAQVTIKADKVEGRPNASAIQTLQGQVAGVNIATGSGQPGSSSSISIRGFGSITGNTQPLLVIDGVPQEGTNMRGINPNDIESVSVLKDAGATALYGNRGANGVIVITTKKAAFEASTKFSYQGTMGVTEIQGHDYNLMNAEQLLTLERTRGTGLGSELNDLEFQQMASESTDWNDYFFRTGVTQSHNLSISSGSKTLSSFTSLGFMEQEGILKNTDLTRFNFRNNLSGKSNDDKFKYGSNLNLTWSKRNQATSLGTGGVNQNYVLGANNSAPYIHPSDYTTSSELLDMYNADGTLVYTPLFLIDKLEKYTNVTDEIKAIAGLQASYEITDGLMYGANLGIDYTQNTQNYFLNADSFNAYVFLGSDQEYGGYEGHYTTRQLLINFNHRLQYTFDINEKNHFEVAALSEYFKGHYRYNGFTQNGLDYLAGSGYGTGYISYDGTNYYVPDVAASKIDAGLFSYFGYVDYDFDSRFGFNGSIRRDASYRFSNTNRWGTFWSVSGRWNIDNEKFMEGSVFDALKLRASVGTTGNSNITGTSLFADPSLSRDIISSSQGYAGGNAYFLSQLGNTDLMWETLQQINVGVDFELFKHRLRGAVDVYEKLTKDMYLYTPISIATGQWGMYANNGKMSNKGIELDVHYDLIRDNQNDFKLTLNFNGAYNKNKVLDIPTEGGQNWDGESLTATTENYPLGEYYVIEYAGVNPTNGNLLFYTKDGEVTENPDITEDRVHTGKTSYPTFQGGFGFDVTYHGFYATTQFNYVTDTWRYDYDYSGLVDRDNIGVFNMSTDILRAWTPENTNTDIPSLDATNNTYTQYSDRFLKDASYLRLRYASVGYNVPSNILSKTKFFTAAKIFVQAENLVTWSKWRGWDAESSRSADQYQYPTPKIYTLGLEFNF